MRKPLPHKNCLVCLKPFSWRKKWERVWEDVKYCSERCRRNKNNKKRYKNNQSSDKPKGLVKSIFSALKK